MSSLIMLLIVCFIMFSPTMLRSYRLTVHVALYTKFCHLLRDQCALPISSLVVGVGTVTVICSR